MYMNQFESAQHYLAHCVINGLQKGIDIALTDGAQLTQEMFAKVRNQNYKQRHPKSHALITQKYLEHCIKNGLQRGALFALEQGAVLTQQMQDLIKNADYAQRNPKTVSVLTPHLLASAQQQLASFQSTPNVVYADNPNDLTIPIGDGLFRDLGLPHAKIQQLRIQQAANPIIQNAFKVIEDADKGFQTDIRYLTDFLHQRRNQGNVTSAKVINMITDDIKILNNNRSKFKTGQNPEAWCIKRLLDDNILQKAKEMINAHPELIKGKLPKPLKEYKSREISVLKTALVFCALARDERNFKMKNIKGAYRLKLNESQQNAIGNMHLVRGLDSKYLYAPLNSYVLRATQIEELEGGHKVMMGDCSGYVTNVLKRLFGEEYPRLFTYDLACFHDYKMKRRQDLSTQRQGPIVSKDGQHGALTTLERRNADDWYRSHRDQFSYLDDHLQTVSDMKNIKPGDLLVWRNKSSADGRGDNVVNGHIGVVLAVDPTHNTATLMENTAGSAYGVGIKNVPIVSNYATTRILRPKISS